MLKPSAARIISCAVAVGVLFAVLFGVSAASSGAASDSGAIPSVQTVFSPIFALTGFLLGAPIGAAVGFLWGRSGLVGALGLILVTLLGGFVGLMLAAWFGAETHVTVTDTSVSMEHGAPLGVLIGGAVLGVIGGALFAWWFRKRVDDAPLSV